MKKRIYIIVGFLLILPIRALAHCPLCTIGAGGAALLAEWLGVGPGPVGIYLGAFALAIGLWSAKFIKKKFVPQQENLIGVFSFASIIFPLSPLLKGYSSIYLAGIGKYGSTIILNTYIIGAIIGALLLWASPYISKQITQWMKRQLFPFQGIAVTFVLLLFASVILELTL